MFSPFFSILCNDIKLNTKEHIHTLYIHAHLSQSLRTSLSKYKYIYIFK